MKTENITTKEGAEMQTKEGKPLVEHRFEIGDEFIPSYNTVLEKTKEVEVKGKMQKITNYSIKAKVRNGETGEPYLNGEEVFVTLTEAQANTLKKKTEEGKELNQLLFVVYEYESEKYGKQIGVGEKKDRKKPKTFEDFEKKEEEQKNE